MIISGGICAPISVVSVVLFSIGKSTHSLVTLKRTTEVAWFIANSIVILLVLVVAGCYAFRQGFFTKAQEALQSTENTLYDGLLRYLHEEAKEDGSVYTVYEGLRRGCARAVHTGCQGNVEAEQNVQIYSGNEYNLPECSGWNCACL